MFYHLGDLDDALTYALGAGSLFDVSHKSEFVQTILGEREPDGDGGGRGMREKGSWMHSSWPRARVPPPPPPLGSCKTRAPPAATAPLLCSALPG